MQESEKLAAAFKEKQQTLRDKNKEIKKEFKNLIA